MKKVVGYARVSTDDQSSFSIPYQKEQIRIYCEKNKYDLVETFVDDGQSAKDFNRKSWRKLDAYLRKHNGSIHYLIVLKYDRFSRNVRDALNVIGELEDVYNITLISISEPINLPPESPFFFQLRTTMLMYAHSERLMIRERTINGMRKAKETGCYLSKAPFGYTNIKTAEGYPTLAIHPEEAEMVSQIFNWYVQGYNIATIKIKSREAGFKLKGNVAIQRILNNRLYLGEVNISMSYETPIYRPGLHPAIISKALFAQVQILLQAPDKVKIGSNSVAYLKQMINCPECFRPMTCSRSKGRSKYYWYYECTGHRKGNPIQKAHLVFESILEELNFSEPQLTYLEKYVRNSIANEVKLNSHKLPSLLSRKKELLQQKETLEEKYFAQKVDDETYSSWRVRFKKEFTMLTSQIETFEYAENGTWNALINRFENLTNIKEVFETADLQQKRNFVQIGFGRILTWDGAIYRTSYLNPLFAHKALTLRQKRLLFLEQKKRDFDKVPLSAPIGLSTEPFSLVLDWIDDIKKISL